MSVQACEAMFSYYQGVYKQIITGDESWIYAYDPEIYRLKGEDGYSQTETGIMGQQLLDFAPW